MLRTDRYIPRSDSNYSVPRCFVRSLTVPIARLLSDLFGRSVLICSLEAPARSNYWDYNALLVYTLNKLFLAPSC